MEQVGRGAASRVVETSLPRHHCLLSTKWRLCFHRNNAVAFVNCMATVENVQSCRQLPYIPDELSVPVRRAGSETGISPLSSVEECVGPYPYFLDVVTACCLIKHKYVVTFTSRVIMHLASGLFPSRFPTDVAFCDVLIRISHWAWGEGGCWRLPCLLRTAA
jgi:hypothetical protein